jgi:hypothetical protein
MCLGANGQFLPSEAALVCTYCEDRKHMQSGCLFVVKGEQPRQYFFDPIKPLTSFFNSRRGSGSTKWNFPSLSLEGVPVLHREFHTFIGD